jgi:tetratricopeptide (TPR) repeat protein
MRGYFEDGVASCEQALDRSPDNLLTIFNLALAHENTGRYTEALAWVGRGLKVEPRDQAFAKLEFRLRVLRVVKAVRTTARKLVRLGR